MKKYLAELLGTFILVGVGGFSVVAAVDQGISALLAAPFGFGLGLMAAIFAVGHVSGGHFNPAVTVAMVLDGRTPAADALGYIVAQVLGAIVGAYTVVAATWGSASDAVNFINNGEGMQSEIGAAFLLEAVLTAIFISVILLSTKTQPATAPLAISWTLAAVHFASVPFTGTSVNPARSIGPAIAAGTYDALWVFVVAPIVGAVVAWAVSRVLRPDAEAAADAA